MMTMKERIKRLFKQDCQHIDRILITLVLALVLIGSIMVASASYAYAASRYGDSGYFTRKQLVFVALGLVIMLAVSRIDTASLRHAVIPIYAVTVLLLLATLAFGLTGNGAQRWIAIGPFTFQPSELAKLALVLTLAEYFTRYGDKLVLRGKNRLIYGIVLPLGITGLLAGLVVLQRHLSGLIIITSIGLTIMFLCGSPIKPMAILGGFGLVGVGALALTLDYARERITVWLDPAAYPLEGGWQTLQGLMAIGSGGFFGLGLGKSRLKYSWVSEPANDFIFTITCEELGFLGASAILFLFFLFIRRGYQIATRCRESFPRIVALGITSKVAIQVLLNVAVITNTIPNTGISLPFFSYGGSSLLMLFAEMGILLSISKKSDLTYC